MPELPEVETIRRGLSDFIVKKKITKIDVLCDKSFIGQPVLGAVETLRRFGKALIIDLDNGTSLMVHLRMTGQLIFDGTPPKDHPTIPERFAAGHPSDNFIVQLPNKQTRVIIYFDTGTLYFNDQRKFGFIKPIKTTEVEQDPFIKKLGKEPWVMTSDELYDKLQKHKIPPIKAIILDQSIIAGLGNIYADESLFAAGIHPSRPSGSLTKKEAARLLTEARKVMDKSIASGGSTMATYIKPDGTKGDYLELFAQVFHKDGQPCPRCGDLILKARVAGRGTHFCPRCQPIQDQSSAHCSSASTEVSQND